ncbi:hypothetical protein BCEN4_540020 [Burkholderia cenocepacia]|nr:hypothetical protein BCEN4_540020 [Burkholderia cenocepacia]
MAVHARAVAHELARVAHDRMADAGQRRDVEQLVERGLVLEAAREIDHVVRVDRRILETRRAAAGGGLAEAVPVVLADHARLRGRDGDDHVAAVVRALREHIDPVGEQAAGAVELAAVQHEPAVVLRHLRDGLAERHVAGFRPRIADELAAREAVEPGRALRPGRRIQPILDEREMSAQRLRQIGIGGGQFGQQPEQLRQRCARAAGARRQPDRAEAGRLQPADRLVRQFAVAFALGGAGGDALEDRPEPARERIVIGTGGKVGSCVRRSHAGFLEGRAPGAQYRKRDASVPITDSRIDIVAAYYRYCNRDHDRNPAGTHRRSCIRCDVKTPIHLRRDQRRLFSKGISFRESLGFPARAALLD